MPPVVGVIAAIGSAIGGAIATIGGLTLFGGTFAIGQAILGFVASTALSMLARGLAPKPEQDAGSGIDQGTTLKLKFDSAYPREIVVGKAGVGGSLVYATVSGTDNKYLWRVIALSDCEIDSCVEIWGNGEKYTFSGDVHTGLRACTSHHNKTAGGACLYVRIYKGTSAQTADTDLITASGGEWTANCRGRGVAYALVRCEYDTDAFKNGEPSLFFVLKGGLVYDPRTATTAWSENAALVAGQFTRGWSNNGVRIIGLGAGVTDVPEAALNDAADICDENVALLAGGTEKRYRVGGVISGLEQARSVLSDLVMSMGGLHIDRGGEMVFLPGAARTPVNAFGRALIDDDFLADEAIVYVPDRPADEIINTVHSTFVDPASAWQEAPLPIYKDTAAITADLDRYPKTRRYRFVTSNTQGQRLNKMAVSEGRFQGRASVGAGLWALEYEPGDWETWTSQRFGGATKTFWVEQCELAISNGALDGNPTARVHLALVEIGASYDDWSTADEAGLDGVVPARPSPTLTLTGLALASVAVTEGGATMPELRASWSAVTHPAASAVEFEYRRTGDTAVYRTQCDPADTATQFRQGIYPKKIYQARGRVRTLDRVGPWTSWVSASVETVTFGGNRLPFDWTATAANITIGDGSAECTASSANWSSQVYSKAGYKGGAYASAQITSTTDSVAMGLNSDPTTNASYTSLDYGFLANSVTVSLDIYESNVLVASLGAYAVGDTIDVSYDGYEVRYYWNGKLVKRTQATITGQLYFDSSFRNVGSKLDGIMFGKGPSPVGQSMDFDAVYTTNMATGKHVARKIASNSAWDGSIYSVDGYVGGANASGSPAQNNGALMFGLNSDPALNDTYTSIDYAWYLKSDGTAECWQSGVQVQTGWTYVAGDTFDVSYDGVVVVFYKNGRVCRSVQVTITAALYFDSSFFNINAELRGIAFRKGPSAFGEDLGFPNLNTETIALGRNRAKKATGSNAWDAQVASLTGYAGGANCSATAVATNTSIMFGLNTDPYTDAGFASIDYAVLLRNNGNVDIYESSVQVAATITTYVAGDTFQVSYDGRAVRYYKNGTLLRTTTASIISQLYFDSSFFHVGGQLDAITFSKGALGGTNEVQPSQVNVNDNANMIQDPNFADAGYWAFATATTYSTDATNIVSQLSAAGGIACALAGLPSGTICGALTNQANWPIVEPGLWYRFRVNTRHSAGFTGVWAINYTWKTAAGVTIGAGALAVAGVNYQTVAAASAGNELLDSRAIQAPSNARFVEFAAIVGCSTTLPNAGTGWAAVPVLQKFVFGAGWQVTTGVSGYVTNINPLSAADIGATATISVAAFSIAYADANGTSRTTAYNAGSITLRAFSTLYYVFANDPGGAGGAVTYVAVTSTNGYADNVNYVYIGSVTTPANGGGGTSGGYQNNGCVAADAFVDDCRRAAELTVGSVIDLLNYDGNGSAPGLIDDAYPVRAQGVRLWTESGATLTCSVSTPITQQSGPDDYVLAVDALGAFVAVKDADGFRWERIIQIDAVGEIDVTRVHCGGGTFAAGDEPGRMIFTHNAVKN